MANPPAADDAEELGHQLLHCAPRLRGFARRLLGQDADDGLQETVAAAIHSLSGFRGEARLSTWFHRLAVRTLCAFRARRDARERHETPNADAAGCLSPSALRAYAATPLEALTAQERRARVQRALDALRPAHREVLLLRGEGLDYAAIAAVLDVPLGTVKSRMHAALVALAERLPDREEMLP